MDNRNTYENAKIIKKKVGVEIVGLDLRSCDGIENRSYFIGLLNKYSLLHIKNQVLLSEELINFSSGLGSLRKHNRKSASLNGSPEIFVISNKVVDGKPLGVPYIACYWHVDFSYTKNPPSYGILYALETPLDKAYTEFIDCKSAYNGLSGKMKSMLDKAYGFHDLSAADKKGFPGRSLRPLPMKDRLHSKAWHPVVTSHPYTKEPSLFVNIGLLTKVTGPNIKNSEHVLEELSNQILYEKNIYTHKWKRGDVLIWDNRALAHKAPLDYGKSDIRHFYRCIVNGVEVPKPYELNTDRG